MKKPLVSIIIPTYNRAHIIGETLESILAQTYTNWECIVVDDGSTDQTEKVIKDYSARDNRLKYHERPKVHLPGGNGARNYGLKKAAGDYIVFFDSDDLMTTDHIQIKINALLKTNCDYVISKTKFFDSLDPWIEGRYKGIKENLSAENFILQEISWLTYDTCIKTKLAKSIQFNENLRSGQEYNYYSKLVLKSVNALFIEKYVTLRREHEGSIRSGLESRSKKMISAFISKWITYLDIKSKASIQIRKKLTFGCIDMIYKNPKIKYPYMFPFTKAVFSEFGIIGYVNFLFMQFFNKYFNKGYVFRKNIERQLEKNNDE